MRWTTFISTAKDRIESFREDTIRAFDDLEAHLLEAVSWWRLRLQRLSTSMSPAQASLAAQVEAQSEYRKPNQQHQTL
jgi:hypothetical protein